MSTRIPDNEVLPTLRAEIAEARETIARMNQVRETLERLQKTDMVYYEVAASWWPQFVSARWLQRIASWYFARKVEIKWGRYLKALERGRAMRKESV